MGSLYLGTNNLQLYQSDLNGGNVTTFGAPLPTGGGEVVVAASPGQAGFSKGNIYAASEANGLIYHYSSTGGTPTLFGSVPTGGVRQIFFDPGNSFGGKMLVSTNGGQIYAFTSAGGTPTLIASIGEDVEAMDIAPNNFGVTNGSLLIVSEGSGTLRAIDPFTFGVTALTTIASAETVNAVPLNLGQSGNPLEGFYEANYAVDVQRADASQFFGLQGDVIVTGEHTGRMTAVHFDGTNYVKTDIGALPNQPEDAVFITAQRISLIDVPEPASMGLLGAAIAGLGFIRRRFR